MVLLKFRDEVARLYVFFVSVIMCTACVLYLQFFVSVMFSNDYYCILLSLCLYTVFQKKTGPFGILSYLCFDSYELH